MRVAIAFTRSSGREKIVVAVQRGIATEEAPMKTCMAPRRPEQMNENVDMANLGRAIRMAGLGKGRLVPTG